MALRVINVRHKGQITLPSDIREELGLKQGDRLLVERDGRKIVLVLPDDVEDPTAGIFKDYAYTHNPDVREEKQWIARHIAETADDYEE
ncbi:MAG TPA: AbrB/MazE/SpoVT family DNA-binding domain-containing protein [Thermomicrobiales bacterium]|nr:AbrB/MazE/SpoVT family DNA-binding domain-containing protein [Thermomicrobiales bacterium]